MIKPSFTAYAVVNAKTRRIIMCDLAGVSWPKIYTRGARRMIDASTERLIRVRVTATAK